MELNQDACLNPKRRLRSSHFLFYFFFFKQWNKGLRCAQFCIFCLRSQTFGSESNLFLFAFSFFASVMLLLFNIGINTRHLWVLLWVHKYILILCVKSFMIKPFKIDGWIDRFIDLNEKFTKTLKSNWLLRLTETETCTRTSWVHRKVCCGKWRDRVNAIFFLEATWLCKPPT